MIDTCAAEFDSEVPYLYSTYEQENESIVSERKKIVVLGSGPIRIGQGVEFDYSTVHAIWAIREAGYEAIIINNNPETVSTDYTTSDKLYFEPLTVEDVMNVIELEKPTGVVVSLGGQTAINLAKPLSDLGVTIIGTGFASLCVARLTRCAPRALSSSCDLCASAMATSTLSCSSGPTMWPPSRARDSDSSSYTRYACFARAICSTQG